jgi:hypothetical protein
MKKKKTLGDGSKWFYVKNGLKNLNFVCVDGGYICLRWREKVWIVILLVEFRSKCWSWSGWWTVYRVVRDGMIWWVGFDQGVNSRVFIYHGDQLQNWVDFIWAWCHSILCSNSWSLFFSNVDLSWHSPSTHHNTICSALWFCYISESVRWRGDFASNSI